MPIERSYLDKTFVVSDSDARIRRDNLLEFVTWAAGEPLPAGARVGDPKRIPKGTTVKAQDVRTLGIGSEGQLVFARVSTTDGKPLGWTATTNLATRFVNETIGLLPVADGAPQTGPNALWENGAFLRQESLVLIVDHVGKVKRLTQPMTGRYLAMVEAARAAGISISLTSGFRSFPEQEQLFQLHLQGGNLAARPGRSPHQNGIAIDIAEASAGPGNLTYDWMAKNATSFGFLRTVDGEPWHWEHRPADAATARANGTCKIRPMSP